MGRNRYKELPRPSNLDIRPKSQDSSSNSSSDTQRFSQLHEHKRTEFLQPSSPTKTQQETSLIPPKDINPKQTIEKKAQNIPKLLSQFYPNATPELQQRITQLMQGSTSNNDELSPEQTKKHMRNDSQDSQELPVRKKVPLLSTDLARDSREETSERGSSDSNRTLRAEKSKKSIVLQEASPEVQKEINQKILNGKSERVYHFYQSARPEIQKEINKIIQEEKVEFNSTFYQNVSLEAKRKIKIIMKMEKITALSKNQKDLIDTISFESDITKNRFIESLKYLNTCYYLSNSRIVSREEEKEGNG